MNPTSDEYAGIEFKCPQCKTALDRYHERCPHCGCALDEDYCATYHPPMPPAIRVIAFVLLVGGVMILLALLLWTLSG